MIVGVPRESFPGERRVALVPGGVPALLGAGLEVLVEAGAGREAGHLDDAYRAAGAAVAASRDELFARAGVILQVRGLGVNPTAGREDLARIRPDQILIGFHEPLWRPEATRDLADRGPVVFAMELMPRITRAQAMDALSSVATAVGYAGALLAATSLPKMFPMMMTAAGTIAPARVFVVGAGVTGLQAIATSRRLGAVVKAYDVRPAVREQVESLGARFLELPLEAKDAEDMGGYARAQNEEFYHRQREMMTQAVSRSDVVLTTAAIPGRKAPILVTDEMVEGMTPGSVVVDLAAEKGGNCELTRPDETAVVHGVTILGPTNLASVVPYHSSQMFSKNISSFLLHLIQEGRPDLDRDDPIVQETLLTRGGQVVHPRVLEALGQVAAAASEGRS